MKTYQVIDSRTGVLMGTYASLKMASRRADKLDQAFGAVRYTVRSVAMAQVA